MNLVVASYCGASPDADCRLSSSTSLAEAAAASRTARLPVSLRAGRLTDASGRMERGTDGATIAAAAAAFCSSSDGRETKCETETERKREREGERESGGGLSVASASACWRTELTKFCAFESSPRRLFWTESKGGRREGGGGHRQAGRKRGLILVRTLLRARIITRYPWRRSLASPIGRTQRTNGMEHGREHTV